MKNEIAVMMRQRKRQAFASLGINGLADASAAGYRLQYPPYSICGSSNGTAFSTSLPPTCLVLGVLITDAAHQSGNSTNPKKNNQAWIGLPASSSSLNLKAHPVSRFRGGFRGSCIWNLDDLEMDGACGETSALMGIDI